MSKFWYSFFFVVCVSYCGAQEWSTVVQKYGQSVCKIEIMSGQEVLSSGSGFVIDRDGKILTNAHVISDAEKNSAVTIRLFFPQSDNPLKQYTASIVFVSVQVDLAVIDIKTPLPVAFSFSGNTTPSLMTEVLVMGYPLGKNFKTTPGFIQAIQTIPGIGEMLDLSAAVDPGSSGGPVIGKDGKVLGVVTAKIPGYNFNLALPAKTATGYMANAQNPIAVQVTSTPSGSMVFANSNYLGKTPLPVTVYGSAIELSVEQDGFQTMKKTITPAEYTVSGKIDFMLLPVASSKVTVTLDTDPSGAQIWIDNVDMGKSPLVFEADKGSRLRIRTKRSSYKDVSSIELIGDKSQQDVKINLQKNFPF